MFAALAATTLTAIQALKPILEGNEPGLFGGLSYPRYRCKDRHERSERGRFKAGGAGMCNLYNMTTSHIAP